MQTVFIVLIALAFLFGWLYVQACKYDKTRQVLNKRRLVGDIIDNEPIEVLIRAKDFSEGDTYTSNYECPLALAVKRTSGSNVIDVLPESVTVLQTTFNILNPTATYDKTMYASNHYDKDHAKAIKAKFSNKVIRKIILTRQS